MENYEPAHHSKRLSLASHLQALANANVLFPAAIFLLVVITFALGGQLRLWILPTAALATVIALRALSVSWRYVGVAVALSALVHVGAYAVARVFFDSSWDGLAYHQEAVLRLAAGWNPIYESLGAIGHEHQLWINHYPKASWILGASTFLSCGQIEAGKLFNFTLIVAAGAQVASVLLRVTRLPVLIATAIAILIAFNPVSMTESTTFCVDGALASLLSIIVVGTTMYVIGPRWSDLGIVLLAVCLAINLKFTALVYVGALMGFAVLITWRQRGLQVASKLAGAVGATTVVAVFLLGYSPYVTNWRDKGHMLYPVLGAPPELLSTAGMRPTNLHNKDRFSRFLIANFSVSESVGRPPKATNLKFPFWIYPSERSAWLWSQALESGGFGPLYGALLLLAGAGAVALLRDPSARPYGSIALAVAGVVGVSVFTHAETWWARYVPQAWLLPMIIATACILSPRRSVKWVIGWALIVFATLNVLFIAAFFTRHEWKYAQETRRSLREIPFGEPIQAHLGMFESLRERLRAGGAEVRLLKAPLIEQPGGTRHPIPSPGGTAFWSK